MLSQETLDAIAGTLGIEAEVFAKGVTSEDEVTLELPERKVFSISDYDTILDNKGKERYDVGKTAGNEMALKSLSEEVGIDTAKNASDFVSSYKALILEEAKAEPNQRISELEASVSNLQGVIETKNGEFNALEGKIKTDNQRHKVQGLIPTLPETIGLSKEEATSLFFMGVEVKEDGVYKNGVLQKDNLENPITLEQSVTDFVTARGWNKTPAGRGGGSGGDGNTKPKTYDEFTAILSEKGLEEGSADANALLVEMAKENPSILD